MKFCIICLKPVGEIPSTSRNGENENYDENCSLVKRFFKLLRRYLEDSAIKSGGGAHKKEKWNLFLCLEEKLTNTETGGEGLLDSCSDCLNIMQSFCELFHQLKTIELRLNWNLWKVKSIMAAAAKVHSRVKHLEEAICSFSSVTNDDGNETGNKEIFKTLLGFKRFLVKSCSQKLARSPPHVLLQRQLRERTNAVNAEPSAILPEPSSVLPDGLVAKDTSRPPISPESRLATTSNDAKVDDTFPPLSVATLPNTVDDEEDIEDTLPGNSSSVLLIASNQHQEEIAEEHLPPAPVPLLDITDDCVGDVSAEDCPDNHNDFTDVMYSAENNAFQQTEMTCPEPEPSSSVLEIKMKSQRTTVVASQANFSVQDNFACVEEVEVNAASTDWIQNLETEIGNLEKKPLPSIYVPSPNQTHSDHDLLADSEGDSHIEDQSVSRTRSLRTVYRCQPCNKTFSSNERLQRHQRTECQSSVQEEEEEEDEEQEQSFVDYDMDTDTTDTSDQDSDLASENEFEDSEMKFQPAIRLNLKTEENVQKVKSEKADNAAAAEVGPRREKAKRSGGRWIARNYHYRFKCPNDDCQELFRHLHDLLLHQKSKHPPPPQSSSDLNTAESSESGLLPVEILRFSEDPSEIKSALALQERNLIKFETFTKIEVGRDVYICEVSKCTRSFFSGEGLEEHKKLHGRFSCEFCPVVRDYLPNLAFHESQMHTKNDAFIVRSKKKCSRCELEFRDKTDYLRHFSSAHFGIPIYTPEHSCAICKTYLFTLMQCTKGYESPKIYLHYKEAHNCKSLHDDDLPLSSPDASEMKSTEKTFVYYQKRYTFFQCPHCDLLFHDVLQLLLHFRKESGAPLIPMVRIKLVVCPIKITKCSQMKNKCKRSDFKEVEDVAEVEVSTSLLGYSGQSCFKASQWENDLVCAVCQVRSPTSRRVLIDHYRRHHNLKENSDPSTVHRCEEPNCSAYFLKSWYLIAHRKKCHNLEGAELAQTVKRSCSRACHDCGKKFSTIFMLQLHRRNTHVERDKLLRCNVEKCRKLCETEEEMKRHVLLIHSSYEMVDCPKCGKSILSGPFLNSHLAWHKRQEQIEAGLIENPKRTKNNVCEQCGKRFLLKQPLQRHMLSHTGAESWEFMCSVCSKKCMTQQKLEEHSRTHTKEKPFVCQVCGVKYAHRHNLRIHVNSKHGDVLQDVPKKYEKTNLTSRKGIKLKRKETDGGVSDNKKRGRRGRPKKQRKIVEESE